MPQAHLIMVGCNHRQTSLTIRERLAFTTEQTVDALAAWNVIHPDAEAVLLSTCNRVELYAVGESDATPITPETLTEHLANFHNVPLDELGGQLAILLDDEAIRHLFRVAASLDSMVIGEAQILSQVKKAYELAGQI